jgi:prevent-host-death family protein
MNVSIKDAKELLEDLVRRAEAGEHVVLTRDGKPVAEIGPAAENKGSGEIRGSGSLPRVGAFKDKEFWMAPDFDELGPEWDEYVK